MSDEGSVATSREPGLVEIVLRVPCHHEEAAVAALTDLVSEGFRHEQVAVEPAVAGCGEAAIEFGVYVPAGEASTLRASLVDVTGATTSELRPVPVDYAERWKAFHEPVTIGRLWVGPPWKLPAPPRLLPVVIEPGQGFGTGAHATTRLVLSLLDEQPRGSVLDVGCGSGVLAVAAIRLGFRPVTAVDNDPAAIASASANRQRNGVEFELRRLDARNEPLPHARLVLANLTYEPLVALLPRLRAPHVVASGLLRSQAADAADACSAAGYVVRERRDRDGWVALVLERADDAAVDPAHEVVW